MNIIYTILSSPSYNDYAIGYGEITIKGIEALTLLAKKHGLSTFYDIGSGNGRSLLMASLMGFQQVQGVEIVHTRANNSMNMLANLPLSIKSKISIFHGSYEHVPIPSKTQPILVFISNILWTPSQNIRLFTFLLNNLVKGSIIVASTITPYIQSQTQTLLVPMSWFYYSYCEVYTV